MYGRLPDQTRKRPGLVVAVDECIADALHTRLVLAAECRKCCAQQGHRLAGALAVVAHCTFVLEKVVHEEVVHEEVVLEEVVLEEVGLGRTVQVVADLALVILVQVHSVVEMVAVLHQDIAC